MDQAGGRTADVEIDGNLAYAAIGPRTYVRTAVTVERVEADRAVLSDGPPVATEVVTVGVAELHGVESGVGGGH